MHQVKGRSRFKYLFLVFRAVLGSAVFFIFVLMLLLLFLLLFLLVF